MSKDIKEWVKQIILAVITVIVSIIIFSFTFGRETKYSETKELKDKVIQLDLTKANKVDVESRCLKMEYNFDLDRSEMKQDFKEALKEIKDGQKAIDRKLDRIILNQ
jgi:flagellar basal body-associated protein FliL